MTAVIGRWHAQIGGFQSFRPARRTIRGFEAMLWLRKGFDFAGARTVCEQNRLLSVCFGLPGPTKRKIGVGTDHCAAYTQVCDKPLPAECPETGRERNRKPDYTKIASGRHNARYSKARQHGEIESGLNDLADGGRKRNRTAVRGFAVLCIATLPSGRGHCHIGARRSL